MNNFTYGTKCYYEKQAELAENKKTLIEEAIDARLKVGKIKTGEMHVFAEILQSVEEATKYAKDALVKYLEENETEEDKD